MLTHWLLTGTIGKASGAVELTADGITTGAASLGVPAITVTGLVPIIRQGGSQPRTTTYRSAPKVIADLAADDLTTGQAFMGSPSMGQMHSMEAMHISTNETKTSRPMLTRSFGPNDNAFWFLAA
jgi:hypothetical protein